MKLEMTAVQKLAKVLKILVMITFVCNLIVLLLVPGLAMLRGAEDLAALLDSPAMAVPYFARSWALVWSGESYSAVLTVFLWACGVCTAIILWQARRVLDTVLAGETFSLKNAANMKRAAVCCLTISAAALCRLVWGFFFYKSIAPLLTYNALFVPVFAMGCLLFLVMSALFRQAAELKEENDLTI